MNIFFSNPLGKVASLLLILNSICGTMWAQNLLFQNYNVEEGLVQSQVNAFSQDSNGYVWIGTYGGLSRFDGSVFTNFSTVEGLPDNYITALAIAPDGTLWCGTSNGLSHYDGKKFTNYSFSNDRAKNFVSDIAVDHDGSVWCITTDSIYEIAQDRRLILPQPPHVERLQNLSIDNLGNIWVGGIQGALFVLQEGKWKAEFIEGVNQSTLTIYRFCGEGNSMWVCTNKGLYYKEGNQSIRPYKQFSSYRIFSNTVTDIKKDKNGIYWIGTENGVFTMDKNRVHYYNKTKGLTSSIVRTIFIDRENNTWIGSTGGEGIFLYTNAAFQNISEANGLTSNNVRGIGKDPSGGIWIATYDGGLNHFIMDTITEVPIAVDRNSSTNITSFLVNGNDIWIALDGNGLVKYNRNTIRHFHSSNSGLPSEFIFTLYADSENRIWIGSGKGVAVYAKGQIKKIKSSKYAAFSFEEIGQDSILVGNMFGLQLLRNNVLKNLPSKHTFLKNTVVYCFLKMGNKLWMGTDNNGILIWDIKTDSLQSLTTKDGMSTNLIYSLVQGKDGLVYAGTGRGIHGISVNKDAFKINRFDKTDGLPVSECNRQSVFLNDDSTIWFGTSKGIFLLNPFRKNAPVQQPKIVMQHVELFSQPLIQSKYSDSMDYWNTVPWNLRLPHDQNNLSFYFKAITFVNTSKITYQYMVEGLETKWSVPSMLNFASYNSLPPGKYIFKARALINDTPVGNILQYPFEIIAPFYSTMWFKIVIVILLITLGVFIQIVRNTYQRRRARQLKAIRQEEQRNIRQKVAEDFHDEMGNKITRINLLTEVLKEKETNPSEANIILDQIKDNARQLFTGTNDIIWSLNSESDNLFDTMKRLLQFAEQLFEDSSITFSCTGMQPELEKIKLSAEQMRNIMMIIKEAFNNSLKHSGAKHVKMLISREHNKINITLADDGVGFDDTNIKEGHGIQNLKRRAERIHAAIVINSKKGHGTSIKLILII